MHGRAYNWVIIALILNVVCLTYSKLVDEEGLSPPDSFEHWTALSRLVKCRYGIL